MSELLTVEKYRAWKKKRLVTVAFFFWLNLMEGATYTAIMSTLLLYLSQNIYTNHVDLFYALITTAGFLSSAVGGVSVAKYVDATRKIKYTINILLCLIFLGNTLYIIPFSPYFPLIGRLLTGVGDSFSCVLVSEMIRMYDYETSNKLLCWISGIYAAGCIIGPLLILPFQNVSFNIGPVHVDKNNVVGLLMAVMTCISLVACQIIVFDCSEELELKEEMEKLGLKEENDYETYLEKLQANPIDLCSSNYGTICVKLESTRGKEKDHPKSSMTSFLSFVIRKFDILFIYFSAFFFMYTTMAAEVLLPVINYTFFGWNLHDYSVVTAFYGVSMIGFSVLFGKLCTTQPSIYVLGMLTMMLAMTFFISLQIITMVDRDAVVDVTLMGLSVFSVISMWYFDVVVQRSILSNMIPSRMQGVTEAVRSGFSRVGMICGTLITPLCLPFVSELCLAVLAILFSMILIYATRIKQLWNPMIQEF